jgi:O-antigen/teichoic acid export membrane protein
MIRKLLPDLGNLVLLLLLPLLLFAPVALGPKTLLPADILFSFEPYRSAAADFGVRYPQNHLLADLILENYPWKRFIVEALRNRQLPLWDPFIFAGHPFLANGQHSALYPLSLLFYALPLWRAYGVFAWLQLGLAGGFSYLFARVLGIRQLGGLISGITFQFSGFMVVSVVHPMVIAGASWLPFVLAMVELIIQQRPALGERPASLPWVLLGAVGLGCQMLAGHAENAYFVFLVTTLYAVWRLGGKGLARRSSVVGGASRKPYGPVLRAGLWLVVMVSLGLGLGAVQFLPLYEVVSTSFRGGEEAATLQQVLRWAYPPRRLIAFVVPNFFGNPAHHTIFDLFSWRTIAAPDRGDGQYVYWGIKNYVEGGAYLGLLPLFLSGIAVTWWSRSRACRLMSLGSRRDLQEREGRPTEGAGVQSLSWTTIPFLTILSLFSLGCMFGTPIYALVYALPFLRQSHSPFRWVFPLTMCVAVLAGFGVEAVQRAIEREVSDTGESDGRTQTGGHSTPAREGPDRPGIGRFLTLNAAPSWVSTLAALAFWGGLVTLFGLGLSRLLFAEIEPVVERVFLALAGASSGFPDARAFYSYEAAWIALFGTLLTATGAVLRLSRCPILVLNRPIWETLAVGVLVLDLVSFGLGFNPAIDPRLLEHTPPLLGFLLRDDSPWRYATFTPPGTTDTMRANVGMFYGLQCVAGYDSLFTDQYRDYMALIEEQDQVQYNRIASFRAWSSLDSPLTDLLNVKYVVTEVDIPSPKYRLVYRDEAGRVYENLGALPRAFTLPITTTVESDDVESAVRVYDPRHHVILEDTTWRDEAGIRNADAELARPGALVEQTVIGYTINEVEVDATVAEPVWLVLADSYFPGWKAFVRPRGSGEEEEEQIQIYRANRNFRAVLLEEPGAWTVRFRYSPNSVKVGAFISFIAGMTLLFLTGLYLWRHFYRASDDADTVKRVAKNSLAPIALNFFNRLIDFAFAALMARILGPSGMGRYFTAANVYLWFDTLANFGLDMYLMREVSRDRDRTRQIFANTTLLRLLLFGAVIPVLGAFLAGRQSLQNPLTQDTVWTILLLYAGLLPGTIANSLTALFRAFEMHEHPAAIQTVTTIIRVTLGTLVLVGGLGIIGLAGVAFLTNFATMTILALLAWRLVWSRLPPTAFHFAWRLQRRMVTESWPLMASLLLQSLFTGANVVMLQYFRGDDAVGWYNAASKWVMNMLNIIPSLFTFAVFPVLARQAAADRVRLRRSYHLSVKLLTIVALPTAMLVAAGAGPLVWVLSGPRYLPHGAVALRLLAWSIVFGWTNSLANYVLIALHRQRYVVLASAARVVFAATANLLLVPRFSYVASAWIITVGELLLYVLFALDLRRELGSLTWGVVLGRPVLAGAAMGATAWAMGYLNRPLALLVSLVVYALALTLLRVLTSEEKGQLASLLPPGVRRVLGTPATGQAASR